MNRVAGRALVLGSDTRSFLTVVRSLGRAGIEVHVAWCPADAPALGSRYIHKVHALPPYELQSLCDLLGQIQFDLVIPCDDFAILPLQTNRKALPPHTRVYLLSDRAFAICSDKGKTYRLAEGLGIPLAQQRAVRSIEEIDEAAAAFGWPLVLKPATSVTAADQAVRHAVRKAWNRDQARALARPPLLVQQNFIGTGVGVEVLARDGEVLAAFQHERVHEPMPGGGSTYRRSVALSPELLDAASRLMRAMRYTGVGMVEFKVNSKTGAWILIEINGRFWGSLPLSVAAGADFPRYLFEMLVLDRRHFPQTWRTGVYARNWMLDLRWMARNLLTDRRDPTLMSRPLWRVAWEFRNLPREHSDTLTADDPGPAWRELRQLIGRAARPVADLLRRRRLYRGAAAAAQRARRVLFVCKGNICRSPFAAEYLRKLAPRGVEIESAGYLRVPDRPSPAAALEAAREFGVHLCGHRSHVLTENLVRRADVIFVFERDQEQALRGWFPEAEGKMHYLSALGHQGRSGVRDPWGGGAAEFHRAYREIAQAVTAGWAAATSPPR